MSKLIIAGLVILVKIYMVGVAFYVAYMLVRDRLVFTGLVQNKT